MSEREAFVDELNALIRMMSAMREGEEALKAHDRDLMEIRQESAQAQTLEEKLACQKRQRVLERVRAEMRRDLFKQSDDIEAAANKLVLSVAAKDARIEELESLLGGAMEWVVDLRAMLGASLRNSDEIRVRGLIDAMEEALR